jgi:hypothetical protein
LPKPAVGQGQRYARPDRATLPSALGLCPDAPWFRLCTAGDITKTSNSNMLGKSGRRWRVGIGETSAGHDDALVDRVEQTGLLLRNAGLLRRFTEPPEPGHGSADVEESGGALRRVAELVAHEGIGARLGEGEFDEGTVAGRHLCGGPTRVVGRAAICASR